MFANHDSLSCMIVKAAPFKVSMHIKYMSQLNTDICNCKIGQINNILKCIFSMK